MQRAVNTTQGHHSSGKVPFLENKERFFKYIAVNSKNGCWVWTGSLTKGYESFVFCINKKAKTFRAHRVSYSIFKSTDIHGLVIDHICRNRSCVNPDHLRAVSTRENVLENSEGVAATNSKKTHCPKGHEYDQKNTVIYNGKRYCNSCRSSKGKKLLCNYK